MALRLLSEDDGAGPAPVAAVPPAATVASEPSTMGASPTASAATGPSAAGGPWLDAERWERVALLPGLELSLRADASPAIRRLAAEICAHYRGSA